MHLRRCSELQTHGSSAWSSSRKSPSMISSFITWVIQCTTTMPTLWRITSWCFTRQTPTLSHRVIKMVRPAAPVHTASGPTRRFDPGLRQVFINVGMYYHVLHGVCMEYYMHRDMTNLTARVLPQHSCV